MLVARIFLHLIFRNPDGSLTLVSWYFVLLSLFMVAGGTWCLLSPQSYVRYVTQGRLVNPPKGLFGTLTTSPRWVRTSGAVAIVVAVCFMGWVVVFSTPGRLY